MWNQIHQLLNHANHPLMSSFIGKDLYPRFLGRALSIHLHDNAPETMLDQIPSETSRFERRFLYNFFNLVWDGNADVLEIGPFLGGTTRAIALGMQANTNRKQLPRLWTYDRFDHYYEQADLEKYVSILFEKGVLPESIRSHVAQSQEFKTLFDAIHTPHSYSELINAQCGILPDSPAESLDPGTIFKSPSDVVFNTVFIDGCKSWYGTKYFMREVIDHVTKDAYFIFQDYGWHTCFWLSACMNLLSGYFSLIAEIDNTYSFQMIKPCSREIIDSIFPDSPEEMGAEKLETLFNSIIEEASNRSDIAAIVSASMQYVGAMAYIGEKERAKSRILQMTLLPQYKPFMNILSMSYQNPAYRPDGNVFLDK